jgi:hypothetical protein
MALAAHLGWPWKESKTHPFSVEFQYIGFLGSLQNKSVLIPQNKKLKYLMLLLAWTPGARFSRTEAEKVLGVLVHCASAVPKGRLRLVALTQFVTSYHGAKSNFTRWSPDTRVLSNIQYWCKQLSHPFCGLYL